MNEDRARDRPFSIASAFAPAGPDRFVGELTEDWYQGRALFGGLTASILVRAMEAHAGEGRPLRTLHTTFCAPATAGPAVVVTEVVREGRSVAFMRARLEREDEVLAIATATFARERRSFAESFEPPRLALPPVDEVAPGPEALFLPSFSRYFQFRQAIGQEAFSGGAEAHVGGWCRLREGPVRAEAALVPVMLDSWAPAALSRHPRWAPCASIDIFVQLHRVLDGSPIDWLGYEAHSAHLDSGYADERATLYDADGRAIASAKQLIAIFD
ncbi:MAG: thioesterase family protein [Sandaracinaceae bacterium]|nr:thioesterase family protein [Sandaracinaceae bacterium]